MNAKILNFPAPTAPGDEPFTLGQCVAFADMIREDAVLSNARKFLQQVDEKLAEGDAGAAIGAMVVCARLLHREIFEIRRTPKDNEHVLFTIPAGRLA